MKTALGWEPTYTFEAMLDEMIWVYANKNVEGVNTYEF